MIWPFSVFDNELNITSKHNFYISRITGRHLIWGRFFKVAKYRLFDAPCAHKCHYTADAVKIFCQNIPRQKVSETLIIIQGWRVSISFNVVL